MGKRYVVTTAASRDLRIIAYYIRDREGGRVANRITARLHDVMAFLADNPGTGHVRHELVDDGYRAWTVWSYIIIYDPTKNPIRVVRILHGARDIQSEMER